MPDECPSTAVRIFVAAQGEVRLNGSPVEVAKLEAAVKALSPAPTAVCYSRANAQGEPPAAAMDVIKVIMALRLPVAFFTDETFKVPVKLQ